MFSQIHSLFSPINHVTPSVARIKINSKSRVIIETPVFTQMINFPILRSQKFHYSIQKGPQLVSIQSQINSDHVVNLL